jgi:hypothetical protein
MDTIILAISLTLLSYFILLHVLLLTILKERHLVKITQLLFILVIGYNIYVAHSFGAAVLLLSSFLLSLFILVYHLSISNILLERSVFIKLISVLKGSQSLEDISKEYNSRNILDAQLKHLVASKVIYQNQQLYTLVPRKKSLFLFDSIKQSLKDLVNISLK